MEANTLNEIYRRLRINEGTRLVPYKDTMGIWTVGVGYNLQKGPRDIVCKELSVAGCPNPAEVLEHHAPITDNVCNALFMRILPGYMSAAVSSLLPGVFAALSPARQVVLVDLEYNLGQRGWLGFVHTRALINKAQHTKDLGNTDEAHKLFGLVADALAVSDWSRQVGNRALRDEAMFRVGTFCDPYGDGSDIL